MAPITTSFTDQPSDLTDFVINKGHGVKGLSETDLKTLPKQYIHPLEERINEANILPQESIPVVDMSKWDDDDDDKAEIAKSICEAAGKWGFFQVVNHCVLIEVLESVKAATHRYFGLSPEEKKKYSKELSPSNNVRFGTSFNTQAEKALEWKDYLSLFYVSDDEASAFWPPDCMNEVLEYMKSSETLIKQLLQVLMKGLNVNEIDGAKEALLMGSVRINLNYYPICPNPELTVGVGRHSDVSSLTVLLQDNIGGLYVRGHQDNSWIHVPPINGSLIINIGDALQILSNGKYKSVEHCVIVNASKNRISVPIFVNPRPQDIISPLPEVLASGEEALYKPVLYSDYVKHFFRKAHDGKKTVDFAKIHKS